MSTADDLLKEFGELLEAEANEKIKKAMQLFMRCNDVYKVIILHETGYKSEITLINLRDHFYTLELLDMLDGPIENMEMELSDQLKEEEII